jgi:hypothetical protein
VTLTGTSSIDTDTAHIVFGGTVDGTQDFEITTTGDITFNANVGTGTRLGDVVIDPRHFTAGSFNAASFTLTNGTGNVSFGGAGLNTTGNIGIDTNGNVTGTYQGANGVFDSGTGAITATVSFTGLDIDGTGATLIAGYIGVPDVADQVMANLISIGGVMYPALIPDPAYTFAGFVIGVRPPGAGGGGGGSPNTPVTPPVTDPITLPGPLTPPVTEPGVRPVTSGPETAFDIARIQREADILVLSAELPREPECDAASAYASCDEVLQTR